MHPVMQDKKSFLILKKFKLSSNLFFEEMILDETDFSPWKNISFFQIIFFT